MRSNVIIKQALILVVFCYTATEGAEAQGQRPLGAPSSRPASNKADQRSVVAHVNGVPITRAELAQDLIARKGKEHLELLINRKIIEQACQEARIQVTDKEVEKELETIVKSLGLPSVEVFEKDMLNQQKITLTEYKEDMVRPDLAMRKLAGTRVQVTEDDLQKAFEASYGEKVRCRVILVDTSAKALQIHQLVRNKKDEFIRQASNQANPTLAATGGNIKVNRHSALGNIEKEAFRLRDGEVSQIMDVPQGFAILLREGVEPANPQKKLADVRESLREGLEKRKREHESKKLFDELKKKAVIHDYLNNKFAVSPKGQPHQPRGITRPSGRRQ